MQNKKLLVIALGSTLFVLAIMLLAIIAARTGKPKPAANTPTVVPTEEVAEPGALQVVKTLPESGAEGVDLEAEVVVSFNREFTLNEISIEFFDTRFNSVAFQLKALGQALTLIPDNPLEQSTVYTVRIRDRYIRTLKELRFLTKTVSPSPDTRPVAAVTETVLRNRLERPDVYLANILPYESQDFTMVLETDAEGYFTFVVTQGRLNGELLKEAVKNWLLSLELTEAQIATLNLEYR